MIDIHTHILYGLDDGALDIQASLSLLKALSNEGIKGIVCTPHVAPLRTYNHSKEKMEQHFNKLKKTCRDQGIDITLFFGAEIDENDDLYGDIKKGFTLNQTKNVLIDFGMREADICEVIYELSVLGYQTIVAHPERYKNLSLKQLIEIKKEGALFQVTANHFLKPKCKKTQKRAKLLLKHDLIDVIASDIHSIRHVESMAKAYQYIVRKKGIAMANKLFIENPKIILGIND